MFLQVLSQYREEGFDFLLKVFNSPNYLEDLTGLSQLYAETQDDQVCNVVTVTVVRNYMYVHCSNYMYMSIHVTDVHCSNSIVYVQCTYYMYTACTCMYMYPVHVHTRTP